MTRLLARTTVRRTLTTLTALTALATITVATTTAAVGEPTWDSSTRPTPAGPPYVFTTALMDGRQVGKPLTNVAVIDRTEHGYVYRAGSQNNHLVVTPVRGGLRFADSRTPRWKHLASSCRKVPARRGVAAVCRVPGGVTVAQPLLVEVWPRIGDDFLDTSALSARFAVTMLGDLGHDTARFGAGPDFFNGHSGRDRVFGGGGADWIRAGDDADAVWGGAGHDYLVGMNGNDVIRGGDGDDQLFGMDGNDRLYPEAGTDRVSCSTGTDSAWVDAGDWARDCETLTRD